MNVIISDVMYTDPKMIPINLRKSNSSTNNVGFCFLAALYASQHTRNISIKVRVIIRIVYDMISLFYSSERTKFLFFASSSILVSIPFQISNIAAL